MPKVTALTLDTAPTVDDLIMTVTDPGGTPASRRTTIQSIQNLLEITAKTASATSAAVDEAKLITMDVAGANVYTIAANATVPHPIGTCILVKQIGAGVTSITGATGVTLEGGGASVSAGSCAISNRYDMATCIKVATNIWSVQGAVGAIA